MNRPWPKERLGQLLRHRKEFVTIDDLAVYRRPRVQLHAQGIVLRDEVPGALVKTKQQQVCRPGELLVAEIDAKVGGIGIVPDALGGAIVSSHYFLFEIDETKLDRRFLAAFVQTRTFLDQIEAQGSTNYAAIRPADVLGYEIPLPPIAEQRRVVTRIEELAVKIDAAHTFRRQSSEDTEALSHAGTEARYQQLRRSFGTERLVEVCKTITDGDHNTPAFSEDGVRFIFVGNVSSGRLHFEGSKRVANDYFHGLQPQRVPRRNDVLYSAVGATLGIPAIVDTDEPFCFQRHVAILKLDSGRLDSQFAWHMLRSRTVFEKAWSATTGSAQPTVPLRAIRELAIPVPPLNDQRRVVAELDAMQEAAGALKHLQAETAAEVDALLPATLDRAFRGEL